MGKGMIGAQLFTCREFTKTLDDVAATFGKIAEIGYPCVQISAFGPVDPEGVGKLLKEHDLICAITHMGWNDFLTDLDTVIAKHKLWGCKHTAIGGLGGEYRSLDGIKRFVDELGPVAEKLAAEGLDFSYHNHNWEFARFDCGKPWLQALLELAGPDILNAEIDTYWVQAGGGDPAAWLTRCTGRCPAIHIKDMAVSEDREMRMAEIGEGNLNWPAIFDAGDAAGVDFYLVEQDNTYGKDPFEALAVSYRNLRAMGR